MGRWSRGAVALLFASLPFVILAVIIIVKGVLS
jgi:hypothetical protein